MALNIVLNPQRIEQLQALGDPNLLEEMCRLFLEYAPERIRGILSGWREKDFTRIAENAHSLKSSSGNLGAMELMNLCQEIESAAEQADETTLAELLVNFEAEARDVLEAVTRQKQKIDE